MPRPRQDGTLTMLVEQVVGVVEAERAVQLLLQPARLLGVESVQIGDFARL